MGLTLVDADLEDCQHLDGRRGDQRRGGDPGAHAAPSGSSSAIRICNRFSISSQIGRTASAGPPPLGIERCVACLSG